MINEGEQKRVTRIIVIEGKAEWVDRTIEKSWLSKEGQVHTLSNKGFAFCTSLTVEEYNKRVRG